MTHDAALSRTSLLALAFTLSFGSLSVAAPSASNGLISVAQVTEMLEKASGDKTARQVLTAYLAGIGETAGALASMGNVGCRTPLSLSAANAAKALKNATHSQDAAETAATPLIVRDMLDRAGCTRRQD